MSEELISRVTGVIAKTLDLGGRAVHQEELVNTLFLLRNLTTGWTAPERKRALDLLDRHHLGNDRQSRFPAGLHQQVQAFPPEPLEGIRRRPGLEEATTQDMRTVVADEPRRFRDLVAAFHRARPGHHGEPVTAYQQVADADDGVG